MNRREFVHSASRLAVAAGAGLLPACGAPPPADRSRVVFYRHSGLADQDEETAAATVRTLVDAAVRDATGSGTAEAAWRSLFSADDLVALKVNCMAGLLSPHLSVIAAIVEGLKGAGVDPDHITVFDKEDRDLLAAGYEVKPRPPGPLCYGTVGGPHGPGYSPRPTERQGSTFRLSNIVEGDTTAIVNLPVVKDHIFAGITGALKNHFGSIHNPEDFHYIENCGPAVVGVNLAPAIRGKQRLIVGDALHVQYDGGPSYQPDAIFDYWGVFAGTDPVAIDSQLLVLIDTLRQQAGLPLINETNRPVRYLEAAAERELGTCDPDQIELVYRDFAEQAAG